MRVLVTGGAGFIGGHLTEALLSHGHDVTVIDNFSSGHSSHLLAAQKIASQKGRRLDVLKKDISDAETWSKLGSFEVAYHLAAQSSVTGSVKNVREDFLANVQPWLHVIEWMRRHPPKLFVYAGTAGACYGEALYYPTDERMLLNPSSPYGATKAFGDLYLAAVVSSLKQKGEWSSDPKAPNYLTWASLRYANIYGPRQRPHSEASVIPIFLEKILSGSVPTIYGDGNKIRDYLYIDDTIAATVSLIEKAGKNPVDEIFNLSLGDEVKDLRVFDAVMDALERYCQERDLKDLRAKIAGIREPIFQPVRPGEVLRSSLSNEKAKAFLGWRPQMSFENGVAQTVMTFVDEYLAGQGAK